MVESLRSARKSLRLYLLLLVAALSVAGASAQAKKERRPQEGMHKELREFRVKFVAQEIDLRDEQKKQFVETYNQLLDDRRDAYADVRRFEKKIKDDKNASEADYKALSDAQTKAAAKIAEINRQYDERLSKFLSQKQIVKMKEAEEKYRTKMMEMRGKSHHRKEKKK